MMLRMYTKLKSASSDQKALSVNPLFGIISSILEVGGGGADHHQQKGRILQKI